MKREERRTGRIAEFEFRFWECWESAGNAAGAIERHWFGGGCEERNTGAILKW